MQRNYSNSTIQPLPKITDSDKDRFAKYVNKTPGLGPTGECWEWVGARSKKGYGVFEMRGTTCRASRIAYAINTGEDPYPFLVTHDCDWPPCARHIKKGTQESNMQEMVDRDRAATGDRNGSRTCPEKLKRGSSHGMSALSEEKVTAMRTEHANGASTYELAAKYKVSTTTISRTLKGKVWSHVPGKIESENLTPRGERHKGSKLTEDQVREIRKKRESGRSINSLAIEYGMSVCPIQAICERRTWRHVQ